MISFMVSPVEENVPLIKSGFVSETPPGDGKLGDPSIIITFNERVPFVIPECIKCIRTGTTSRNNSFPLDAGRCYAKEEPVLTVIVWIDVNPHVIIKWPVKISSKGINQIGRCIVHANNRYVEVFIIKRNAGLGLERSRCRIYRKVEKPIVGYLCWLPICFIELSVKNNLSIRFFYMQVFTYFVLRLYNKGCEGR